MKFLLLPLLLIISGCAIVGVIGGAVAGKVSGGRDATYTPTKTPMVVLVDRGDDSGLSQDRADRLAMLVQQALSAEKVAPMIENVKVLQLRSSMEPQQYNAMTLAQKAQALGASQILHILVKRYDPSPVIGGNDRVSVTTAIRVHDAAGKQIWPVHPDGERVQISATAKTIDGPTEELAAKIVAYFHDRD